MWYVLLLTPTSCLTTILRYNICMGCGCIVATLLLFGPRLAVIFMWLFTSRIATAFDTFMVPLIGLIFLPFTTLMYVFVYTPGMGLSTWDWILLVIAFLFDLGSYGGSAYSRKR